VGYTYRRIFAQETIGIRRSPIDGTLGRDGDMPADEPVTLEFLAAQQRQILDGQRRLADQLAMIESKCAIMQDDIHLLVATATGGRPSMEYLDETATRQNNVNKSLLDMIDRLDTRLRRLETPPG
jgi:hypothetical protein